jgi:Zn-dependent protease with chaperone function
LGGWWLESSRLADGGHALAKRIGAQPAQRLENNRGVASSNADEIQFTNIVQEMALAANMRAPAAFVLPRDGSINAFAAGWDEHDSVICVTQGALDHLTRDELMGLVAHEFSHIYEGDTRLNMRLAGMVLGLELLHNLGVAMTEGTDDKLDAPGMMLGSVLRGAGWLGWTAARMMKAAISREREFLADARAVQYTRQKDGLGATLRKVQWQQDKQGMGFSSIHPAVQHMLLVGDWVEDSSTLLQTHPPIAERIKRIYGRTMPALNADEGSAQAAWKNPFAASQPLPFAAVPQHQQERKP